jgi:hypothetical protein
VVTAKINGKSAVEDYFSSLLFDSQSPSDCQEAIEPAFRFARVEPGYEVLNHWTQPLSKPQQFCADLLLLSCLKEITGKRLRQAMLDAIKTVRC